MLTRMPMGAKASTSALYQAMVAALGRALYKYALVWADDIIIFSANIEDHIRHVKNVLTRLDKNGFCIAKDKVELGKKEVKWLGYIISERGVRPDDEKVQKASNHEKAAECERAQIGIRNVDILCIIHSKIRYYCSPADTTAT